MCPNCPARAPETNISPKPCPCGCLDPRECLGDHACENLAEQAMIQARTEKCQPPDVKNE